MNTHSNCPACNSSALQSSKWLYSSSLLLCKQCGLVFDKRIPSVQELTEHYNTYSYSGRKPVPVATKLSFDNLLDKFEPYRKFNNILDVGCGQGDFLLAAQARGWNVYGSEYSPAAVKLCKDAGITMWQGEFRADAFGDVVFDCVTSFEVLEHTNQPRKLISQSIAPLRKGGLFYLTTPNFNSIMRYLEKEQFKILGYPEHLAFYTKKSIRLLLSQYDLVEKKVLTTGIDISRIKDLFRKVEQQKTSSTRARKFVTPLFFRPIEPA